MIMHSFFFLGWPAACELWLLPEDPDGFSWEALDSELKRCESNSSRKSLSNRLGENASSRLLVFVRFPLADELLLSLASFALQDVMCCCFGNSWWLVWADVALGTRVAPDVVWDTVCLSLLTKDPFDQEVVADYYYWWKASSKSHEGTFERLEILAW